MNAWRMSLGNCQFGSGSERIKTVVFLTLKHVLWSLPWGQDSAITLENIFFILLSPDKMHVLCRDVWYAGKYKSMMSSNLSSMLQFKKIAILQVKYETFLPKTWVCIKNQEEKQEECFLLSLPTIQNWLVVPSGCPRTHPIQFLTYVSREAQPRLAVSFRRHTISILKLWISPGLLSSHWHLDTCYWWAICSNLLHLSPSLSQLFLPMCSSGCFLFFTICSLFHINSSSSGLPSPFVLYKVVFFGNKAKNPSFWHTPGEYTLP